MGSRPVTPRKSAGAERCGGRSGSLRGGAGAAASRARGFTLIELLTVLVIIGILGSILFTVFSKARSSARKRRCQSEVRELSKAWYSYWKTFGELESGTDMDAAKVRLLQGENDNSVKFMEFPPAAQTAGFRDPWGGLYHMTLSTLDTTNTWEFATKTFLANKNAYEY